MRHVQDWMIIGAVGLGWVALALMIGSMVGRVIAWGER